MRSATSASRGRRRSHRAPRAASSGPPTRTTRSPAARARLQVLAHRVADVQRPRVASSPASASAAAKDRGIGLRGAGLARERDAGRSAATTPSASRTSRTRASKFETTRITRPRARSSVSSGCASGSARHVDGRAKNAKRSSKIGIEVGKGHAREYLADDAVPPIPFAASESRSAASRETREAARRRTRRETVRGARPGRPGRRAVPRPSRTARRRDGP